MGNRSLQAKYSNARIASKVSEFPQALLSKGVHADHVFFPELDHFNLMTNMIDSDFSGSKVCSMHIVFNDTLKELGFSVDIIAFAVAHWLIVEARFLARLLEMLQWKTACD